MLLPKLLKGMFCLVLLALASNLMQRLAVTHQHPSSLLEPSGQSPKTHRPHLPNLLADLQRQCRTVHLHHWLHSPQPVTLLRYQLSRPLSNPPCQNTPSRLVMYHRTRRVCQQAPTPRYTASNRHPRYLRNGTTFTIMQCVFLTHATTL